MEQNDLIEGAAFGQQQCESQQYMPPGLNPKVEAWQLELYYLLESIEACQQQLVLLSGAHFAAGAAASVPVGDAIATGPDALPAMGESRTQELTLDCIALLSTDTATPAERKQAEMSLMQLQGSPGYLILLLQCYLRCTATSVAAAAVAAKGAEAASDRLVQLVGKLPRPTADDTEAAFAALVLLKGALQGRHTERSSNAVPNVRRGELAFVQSLLVCLYKLLGVPQCPRIFKVYTALLRRVARAAATAAATAAIVDKLEQMLSEQSVQQTLNSYCNYSSSWGGVLPLSCGAQSLQQMVQEVAALDGAVLLLLLETTVLRLLRAAQRNDADTALYAHLLKHLLKELVTVKISTRQLFSTVCKVLVPFLRQLAAAFVGRLLPFLSAHLQLLGEWQQLQLRLNKHLGYIHGGASQQQQDQQQELQWLQGQVERMQRETFSHSDCWKDLAKLVADISRALLLCEARAGRALCGVGDVGAVQKLQELLLLLLLQQQQAGSCIAYTDASARIVLKLQKVLLRGFAELADCQPWVLAKMSSGSVLKLLLAAVEHNKLITHRGNGDQNSDPLLLFLDFELIMNVVGGYTAFLLDSNSGHSELKGLRSDSAAPEAFTAQEERSALMTRMSEDLRSFLSSVGGLQSLIQDIAPAFFRASDVEAQEFLSRPEELYGGLGCVEEGSTPMRDTAVERLHGLLSQGLLSSTFVLRLIVDANNALERLTVLPAPGAAVTDPATAAAGGSLAASANYLAQLKEADGVLALLAASLQGASRAGIFEPDEQQQHEDLGEQQQHRHKVVVQILGTEAPIPCTSPSTQQQLQQILQQFSHMSSLLRRFITTGPFAPAVAAAAASKDQETSAAFAIVAARCCSVLKLLLQMHSAMLPADFCEVFFALVEDLLVPQPLIKVLVGRHIALRQQQQVLLLQQQQQQQELQQHQKPHEMQQLQFRLQELETLVEAALTAPLFQAVTNCVQVGALSVARTMINSSIEQQDLRQPSQQQQLQHELLKLPFREIQRPFLLLLAQSNRSLWSSRLLKILLLMQSEAREELQKKPLQDDFFDFSDLPNYSDVAYLRRIIMHSCSNGTTGGGEFRCSQVYDQLLSHFKAYSNDEALQVLLLTFLHGAMLIGRPEVPLRFPAGTPAAPALPMGLLTAALQAAGWAMGAGAKSDVPAEPSGALQRCGLRLFAGIIRAADPLRHPQEELTLLLQVLPAVADMRLTVAEAQQPLLLLCLLEATALCIVVGASPVISSQVRQMASPLLPLVYNSVETRMAQSSCLSKVVQQQLRACALLILLLLLLDRGDWPALEKLLQEALAETAIRASVTVDGDGRQEVCGSLPVLCCWGLRHPLKFVAAAAGALASTAADVRQEFMGPFMFAPQDVQVSELLLRFAAEMLATKRAAYFRLLAISFATLSLHIISRALSIVPSYAPAGSSSDCTLELLQQIAALHMERCAATLESAVQLITHAVAASNGSKGTAEIRAQSGGTEGISTGPSDLLVSSYLERQLLSLSGEAASGAAAAAAALQQPACPPGELRRCLALLHISLSGASLEREDWKDGLAELLADALHTAKNCLFALRCIASGAAFVYPGGPPLLSCILEGPPTKASLGLPTQDSVTAWRSLLSAERQSFLEAQLRGITLL
ncbi:hypothetical protein, conserved [Eimeria necatrix]|uniref:Uncharacterized protein n=1 Tax=Eimeria necatrix TaxID=51315 RepID=U6MD77_9EIME|nr:hypothetical protein, conserved [Eimeria necatrix]CDJ62172.1 hypothetical protein, conserved [Eimeria necatrix]